MIFSFILVFIAVLLTGISQVLLKIGSAYQGKQKYSVLAPYLNLPTLCAYGILLFVTVISVIALKEVPLKVFYAIASLGFLVVAILSWGILKEKVNKKMMAGIILIVLGVVIFNIPIS
jgi:drug/metabolite transporter (DMT)-like permease